MSHPTRESPPLSAHSRQMDSAEYLAYGQLAEEVNACLAAGREPDVEVLAAQYPALTGSIRQLVPALVILHQLGSRDGKRVTLGPDTTAPDAGRLGDYCILREIGRGGMGVVYEAEQVSLRRRVALKVLPFAAVMDQRQLARFKTEAQAAAQLHHTNIVPVFSVGCERGVHYYAMQYIEGHTLAEVILQLRKSLVWTNPLTARKLRIPEASRSCQPPERLA